MKVLSYLFCALRNLKRKKFRSILTIVGIVIGVASVIIIGNIGNGATTEVDTQLNSFGINGVNISKVRANIYDTTAVMTQDDLAICKEQPETKRYMPLIMQYGNVVLNEVQKDAVVWGVDSNAKEMISFKILHGKMFTKSQVSSHDKVCLLDKEMAKSIYKRTNVVGKTLYVFMGKEYEEFKIIGIVESGSNLMYNFVGEYMPTFVYLPYTTAEDLRGQQGFDQIMINGYNGTDLDRLGKNVCKKLQANNNCEYVSSNMLKQKDTLSNILNIVTLSISAVGAISLIVAGLGIMTVMLVSVNERTKEIGIKKAIGANKTTILIEFLFEATAISVFGGIMGIITGLTLSKIISQLLQFAFVINYISIILATAFALITGIVFGVYPAYKAANLKPVDALKQE